MSTTRVKRSRAAVTDHSGTGHTTDSKPRHRRPSPTGDRGRWRATNLYRTTPS